MEQQQATSKVRDSKVLTFSVRRDVKKLLVAGKRFFDDGHFDEAIEQYERALQSDPDCALIHFNLALAYHEREDLDQARHNYERALDLQPDCSLFYEHLARLHFQQGEWAKCITYFSRALRVGGILPISYGLLGRAYAETGRYQRAARNFQQMIQKETAAPLVRLGRYHLVLAYLRMGCLYKARYEAKSLLEEDQMDTEVIRDLGLNFLDARCVSMAKCFLERLIIAREELLPARARVDEIADIEKRISGLLVSLEEEDEERLLYQIHHLSKVGSEEVSQALLELRHSRSPLVREAVIDYHRKFGLNVFPVLEDMLGDESVMVREKIFQYIAETEHPSAVDIVSDGLRDSSPVIRGYSAAYLRECGDIANLPGLELASASEDHPNVQREIRRAIADVKRRHSEETQEMFRTRMPGQIETTVPQPLAAKVLRAAVGIAILVLAAKIVAKVAAYITEHGLPF